MTAHPPLLRAIEYEDRRSLRSAGALSFSGFMALLAFFAVAVILQHLGGAYRAEFSGYPDEPGHFVSGVMVREYLSTLPPVPMLPFAKEYYVHYPKVAIGHWPPAFYLLQGIWFLLFQISRGSALALMALISALVSATVYGVVRREFGVWAGVAAGLLFQCLPFVVVQTGQVMADLLVSLFGLWSALAFADFVREGRRPPLFHFAMFALLAIFTKNNGLFLALTPPLALILTRRPRVLLDPWLWLSALLVGLPAGAWVAFSSRYVTSTWAEAPNLRYFARALGANGSFLVSTFGFAFFALICVGLFQKVVRPLLMRRGADPLWAVLASVAVSVYGFQSVISAGLEPRFMIPALPALIPFLFAGAEWLAQLTAPLGGTVRFRSLALLGCAAALFASLTFAVPRKSYCGFSEAADFILSRQESRGTAILVSSETDGEGLLISEFVMRRPSPSGFVLRASKVLYKSDWLSRGYRARFRSVEDMRRYLEDIPVDFVVIDKRPALSPLLHHRHLMEMLEQHPESWRQVGAFPLRVGAGGEASTVLVYLRSGAPGHPEERVRAEMREVLHTTLDK